ncbi:hypothetical protein R1flu_009325 [Riccia fluitans]|uniref:Uncharacterized protein n=1 Tax=Riccia fluitans TaxID=41844 RepID=A0ABD1Z1X6_9MARC
MKRLQLRVLKLWRWQSWPDAMRYDRDQISLTETKFLTITPGQVRSECEDGRNGIAERNLTRVLECL